MKKILGIDEAGRGPVIGPLVVCGVLCDETKLKELKKLGVKDSKMLTPSQRNAFVPLIKELAIAYETIQILPDAIEQTNLTILEMDASVELINKFCPDKVIIDTPVSPSAIPDYSNKIRRLLTIPEPELIIIPKADQKYPIVSAASILAKVTRDNEIEELHKKYGDFGSGYPHDPKTHEFIKNWNKCPEIVRKNWSTCESILVEPGKIMVISENNLHRHEFCKSLINTGFTNGLRTGILNLDTVNPCIGPEGSICFGIVEKMIRKLEKITPTLMTPFMSEDNILKGIKDISGKLPSDINFVVIHSSYNTNHKHILQQIELLNPDKIVLLEGEENKLETLASLLGKYSVYRFSSLREV
ncbi:MAG: ribonuclease HII [bacterium]|nr:ribonuclease HII [bacterium]